MIRRSEIVPVAVVNKTHGIGGELSVTFDPGIPAPEAGECLVMDMEGIYVPFYIESVRSRGSADTYLIKFEDFNDDREARALTGKTLYLPASRMPERSGDDEEGEGMYASDLIGFEAYEGERRLGRIADVNEQTENALFVVDTPSGGELLIPVTDDFIEDIDTDNSRITFSLPQGLTEE